VDKTNFEAVRLGDILDQDFRVTPPIGRSRDLVIGIEDENRVGYITLGDGATVRLYRKGPSTGTKGLLGKIEANFDGYVKGDRVILKRVRTSELIKSGFYTYYTVEDRESARKELLGELEARGGRWHGVVVWDREFTVLAFSKESLAVVLSGDSVSFFLGEPLSMGRLRSFLERWLK
jgi:hypothetical protein